MIDWAPPSECDNKLPLLIITYLELFWKKDTLFASGNFIIGVTCYVSKLCRYLICCGITCFFVLTPVREINRLWFMSPFIPHMIIVDVQASGIHIFRWNTAILCICIKPKKSDLGFIIQKEDGNHRQRQVTWNTNQVGHGMKTLFPQHLQPDIYE